MTFIQQDAVLFAGSLRANLDPFGEYSDEALEAALAKAAPLALLLALLPAPAPSPCSQPKGPLIITQRAAGPQPGGRGVRRTQTTGTYITLHFLRAR